MSDSFASNFIFIFEKTSYKTSLFKLKKGGGEATVESSIGCSVGSKTSPFSFSILLCTFSLTSALHHVLPQVFFTVVAQG
jgi:hypothetical protein